MIAVPVSIIGTFAVMLLIGYSANTVSLLALVLAIGIVVDDAIVVLENIERVIEEEPELSIPDACKKAMRVPPQGGFRVVQGGQGGQGFKFPVLNDSLPCSRFRNSLFEYAGNWIKSPDCIDTIRDFRSRRQPSFAKFPVFFPVIRELGAETGSRYTGSSGTEFVSNRPESLIRRLSHSTNR